MNTLSLIATIIGKTVMVSLLLFVTVASAAANSEKEVLAAHERRLAATLAGDAAALDSMMTDDLTFMHPDATVETKAQFIEAVRSKRYQYRSLTDEARQIRVHDKTGIVSGVSRIVLTVGGQEVDVRVAFTELWVKKGKSWKMALWQATEVPAAA
jgi:ketosteroid isomerase-like protein